MTPHLRSRPLLRAVAWAAMLATPVAWAADAPSNDGKVNYTVAPGDTLIGLSQRVFTSPTAWREIATLNRLRDPNRIRPGQVLSVPEHLLRWAPKPVRVVVVTGDVRSGTAAATVGTGLAEGQRIETGAAASTVLELADGSRVKLPPSSLAEVTNSRSYATSAAPDPAAAPAAGLFAGAMRIVRGSVEVIATKVLRAKPLEVRTPTAVVGVRGTRFRVAYDEQGQITRAEVLEGSVQAESGTAESSAATGSAASPAGSPAAVGAGFGTVLASSAGSSAPQVSRLPEAPDLSAVPALFERPLVRFAITSEATSTLRTQVAHDAAFDRIVDDQIVAPGGEARVANLEDGTWYLRARRQDAQGLQGNDSARPFVLKARPEPPASSEPRPRSKLPVGEVRFAWARNLEAATYRLQIARDVAFTQPVLAREGIEGGEASATLESPGELFWRLASTRADGDKGPFGDPQRFELRPLPEPPKGGVTPDGFSIALNWSGRPEDRQRVQLARDAAFTDIVATAELTAPEWQLPTPMRGGTLYFRYQSIEPDGYVSPFSSTLVFESPTDWRHLLILAPLVPLLLLL